MPLNVRRLYTSIFLVLVSLSLNAGAQTPPQTAPQQAVVPQPQPSTPTSGDVMRGRIAKAKAFIAVRNYNAAIYELENIRRETNDAAVHGVLNVLLTNSYLEQGDYKRAQELLTEFYTAQKTTKPNAVASYMAVAGQIVKGARNRVERYRALGLSVSDRTLPIEATNDLERMRETLELVVTQAKEMGTIKARSADAMALLEEASNSRSMLARDDYDSRRWKDEVSDTREKMMNTGSVVLNAVNDGPVLPADTPLIAGNTTPTGSQPVMQPVADVRPSQNEGPPADPSAAKTVQPIYVPSAPATGAAAPVKEQPQPVTAAPELNAPANPTVAAPANDGSPLDVGSLVAYATTKPQPIYPPAAKSFRTTGVVKVEVTVNEEGDVTEVQKASGPSMLQSAAKDAIKKWKFKPFLRDGQPVRATGFVSFNFAL